MRHISFPSIEQFRNVVKNVQHRACYGGQDEAGETIYNWGVIKPTLKFQGTVKLHGTNAAVCQDLNSDEIWAQSRENVITPTSDNMGFATFVYAEKHAFEDIISTARGVYGSKAGWDRTLCVFGEWCGGNIQKSVALSQLSKMFVVFAIALVDAEGHKIYFTRDQITDTLDGCGFMYGSHHREPGSAPIWNIYDFQVYDVEIDFERPELSQNTLAMITANVEACCPFGGQMGVIGTGEGVVWRCVEPGWEDSGYWFKVKGEKHSATKVKKLASVDIEKVNSIKECVEKICTENRMLQMYQKLWDGKPMEYLGPDTTEMGPFLKALAADCFKEELDTVIASGLEPKDVTKEISNVGRRWFMGKL